MKEQQRKKEMAIRNLRRDTHLANAQLPRGRVKATLRARKATAAAHRQEPDIAFCIWAKFSTTPTNARVTSLRALVAGNATTRSSRNALYVTAGRRCFHAKKMGERHACSSRTRIHRHPSTHARTQASTLTASSLERMYKPRLGECTITREFYSDKERSTCKTGCTNTCSSGVLLLSTRLPVRFPAAAASFREGLNAKSVRVYSAR